MNDLPIRITIRAEQCHGQSCIRGMRIRVTDVLEMLAGGMTHAEILADYPYLEPDDIRVDYGEFRNVAIGFIEARLFVCAYVDRNDERRVISLCKANKREVQRYGEKLEQNGA